MRKIICGICKEEKEETAFRKDPNRKNGLDRLCKECQRKKEVIYRNKNRDKIRERQRIHYAEIANIVAVKRKEKYDVKKAKARSLAKKIPVSKCIFCEDMGERHHPNYDNPLDVVFLCKSHHKQVHDKTIILAL